MNDTPQTVEAFVLVVEAQAAAALVEGGEQYAVTLEQPETLVVAAGGQGPPGPPGAGAAEWQSREW